MIIPDARSRLTTHDLVLLARSQGVGDNDLTFAPDLDLVLDQPEIKAFLLAGEMPGPSASLLFYVLVRHALVAEGLTDRILADYLAALLRDFGVRRRANRIGDHDDHEHSYMVDILTDLANSTGERHFRVSVHLGNYALWLTGIFPDWIEARRAGKGGPSLRYYEALGQRGFTEASENRLAERSGLDAIFQVTGDRFPTVRRAVNRVRADIGLAA